METFTMSTYLYDHHTDKQTANFHVLEVFLMSLPLKLLPSFPQAIPIPTSKISLSYFVLRV